MKMPRAIAGVKDVAETFDVFFLDQYGVLHDGQAPYPGAPETLQRLKEAGKRIVLLSNSGKRSAANAERIAALGFARRDWDLFLTSGETAWRMLKDENFGEKRCLFIGRGDDRSAIEGLDLAETDAREADVVLLTGSEADRWGLDHYRDVLREAAARGVPCICTNPDKIMLTPGGAAPGAGRIAELYEELGGEVRWIGKPYPEIYRAALAAMGEPKRVLAIGDSIEHDIAGAKGVSLSAALVLSGIIDGLAEGELHALYTEHQAVPDYTLPQFLWEL